MRRIDTISIKAGETPQGTLTMATHPPRRVVNARVVRSSDYTKLWAVVRAVEEADKRFPFAQDKPVKALRALTSEQLRVDECANGRSTVRRERRRVRKPAGR
jgi:hypothetical protein